VVGIPRNIQLFACYIGYRVAWGKKPRKGRPLSMAQDAPWYMGKVGEDKKPYEGDFNVLL